MIFEPEFADLTPAEAEVDFELSDISMEEYQEWYERNEEYLWNPIEQGFYDDDPNPYHGDF